MLELGGAFGAVGPAEQDALIERLLGLESFTTDPGQGERPGRPERRLMLDMLRLALKDAFSRSPGIRDGARCWLRGVPGLFTAEECCEELGISYAALCDALERVWTQAPRIMASPAVSYHKRIGTKAR